jgi:hypothetical protein
MMSDKYLNSGFEFYHHVFEDRVYIIQSLIYICYFLNTHYNLIFLEGGRSWKQLVERSLQYKKHNVNIIFEPNVYFCLIF